MHVFSWCARGTKSQQGTQKNCAAEFLILSALKLRSCGLVVFTDMNTDITEDRNFKTFLKENYATAWDNCYIFIKKKLNMVLNKMLIVLMECDTLVIPELYSRFNECLAIFANDEFDGLLVCNIIGFFFICL